MHKQEIEQYYQKFKVPLHIQAHMKKVAYVTKVICEAFQQSNIQVNEKVVYKAALLHDVLKVCDIREFDPQKVDPEADQDTIKIWMSLREEYGNIGHEEAMYDVLIKDNQTSIARPVKMHGFKSVFTLSSWEEKILFYADKRVKHDTIVSLSERLKDGRERYPQPKAELGKIEKTEKAIYQLEKDIFEHIDIAPEDIKEN